MDLAVHVTLSVTSIDTREMIEKFPAFAHTHKKIYSSIFQDAFLAVS